MKCPVCRAAYQPGQSAPACRRCGADLSTLIQIHDRALWHYRQAIAHCHNAAYPEAQTHIQQALALNSREASFHALAGQIWALQGNWQPAIAVWKHAQQLDPRNAIATHCLKLLAAVIQGE
jgi:Flp pilus assembly protein TadD